MREGPLMLLLFRSTREVISAEEILRAAHIACRIIPVPRIISSECGMAIEIDAYDGEAVMSLLQHINPKRYDNEHTTEI